MNAVAPNPGCLPRSKEFFNTGGKVRRTIERHPQAIVKLPEVRVADQLLAIQRGVKPADPYTGAEDKMCGKSARSP
jgi:hypothetical protein